MSLEKKGRVAVAMSGGVDSSTTAAILKAEGYEVIGLTMHLWDQTQDGKGDFWPLLFPGGYLRCPPGR